MKFIRWLLALGQGRPQHGRYVDPKFRFSLRIPGGWRRAAMVPEFRFRGGRVALTEPGGATFNVSCGPPDPGTPTDKIARVERAREFLARSVPGAMATPLRDVTGELSGETNAARAEVATLTGFHGLISIVSEGIEYVLQYGGDERTRQEIESLIASFSLPGTANRPRTAIADFWAATDQLDAEKRRDREAARRVLAEAGADAVPAILASVNACNQAIMAACAGGPRTGEPRIRALRRRIELLGQIGDERGIPAILNAIGDSANTQDISPEARHLLSASQDALVKLGSKAVDPIAKVVDTPGARIRLALVQVLEKIGGVKSQRVLETVLDDPEEDIRAIARRATGAFDFRIKREKSGSG